MHTKYLKKWNSYILHSLATTVKYFKLSFCFNLQLRKLKQIQYLKILEYFLRSVKVKEFTTQKCPTSKTICSFMHSILDWGSFSVNYCVDAAWHWDTVATEEQVAFTAAFSLSELLGGVFLTAHMKLSLSPETSYWTSTWILCHSTLPSDSGTLILKWKEKCTFI